MMNLKRKWQFRPYLNRRQFGSLAIFTWLALIFVALFQSWSERMATNQAIFWSLCVVVALYGLIQGTILLLRWHVRHSLKSSSQK